MSSRKLPKFVFDYIDGGAGAEACVENNRKAIDRIRITPKILEGVSDVKLDSCFFGNSVSLPLALAPMGLTNLIDPHGPLLLARACARAKVPFALSSATALGSKYFSQIPPPWYQLYIYDTDTLEDDVGYIRNLGCDTLIITVDLPVGGRRIRDIRNDFSAEVSLKMLAQASVKPSWVFNHLRAFRGSKSVRLDPRLVSRSLHALTWAELSKIREIWTGNLIVKGVLDPDDALRCVSIGVDALVISNHGGRQFDGAPSPFMVLEEIACVLGRRLTIFVDGGITSGEDIVKALALGADGVLLGRIALYALASGGEQCVYNLIDDLRSQTIIAMKLLGCRTVDALRTLRTTTVPDLSHYL